MGLNVTGASAAGRQSQTRDLAMDMRGPVGDWSDRRQGDGDFPWSFDS